MPSAPPRRARTRAVPRARRRRRRACGACRARSVCRRRGCAPLSRAARARPRRDRGTRASRRTAGPRADGPRPSGRRRCSMRAPGGRPRHDAAARATWGWGRRARATRPLAQPPLAVDGAARADLLQRRREHHRAGGQRVGSPLVDPGQGEALLQGGGAQRARQFAERVDPDRELVQRGRGRGPAARRHESSKRPGGPAGDDARRMLHGRAGARRRAPPFP